MPSETKQEHSSRQGNVETRQKLFKTPYEREFLITTLIKHIRAGNTIDDEITLCLRQEFDMCSVTLTKIGYKEGIKMFRRNISFESDQPFKIDADHVLSMLYPLYEGESYLLENPEQHDEFQTLWQEKMYSSSLREYWGFPKVDALDVRDPFQEKIRLRQEEVQKYQEDKAKYTQPLDMALFALQTCKKIKKIIFWPILNMGMIVNFCYEAYCLVKTSYHLPLSGAIIRSLKKQLEELQDDAWIQTEFREIVNLLTFSVHLFEQKNQVGENDKKNIDEYFRKAVECDSALMYQSFWTSELRRATFFAYAEEYLNFYKVNQSIDDLVSHMIKLARQQVASMKKCVSIRILLSDDIEKTFSAHHYYAMVTWLKDVGLLSKESEILATLVKDEREKIRTRTVVIKKVPVLVKTPAQAAKILKKKTIDPVEKPKPKKESVQKPSLLPSLSSPEQVQRQEQLNEQERERIKRQQAEQKIREDARLAQEAVRLEQEAANKREQTENERKTKKSKTILAQLKKDNQVIGRQAAQRAIVAEKKAKREAEAAAKQVGKQKKTQKTPVERAKTKTVNMAVVPVKKELPKKTPPPLQPLLPLLDPLRDFSLDAFEADELSVDNRDLLKSLDGIVTLWDGRLEIYGSYVIYLAMCRLKETVKIRPNDLDLRIEIKTDPELQITALVRQLLNLKFKLKDELPVVVSLSEHLNSQMQNGYLNLYRVPQDREKHSYKIELTIMLSGVYQKNKNPFLLTDHSIVIARNQGFFDDRDLRLQTELKIQVQKKIFTVDIMSLTDPACNVFKVFPRAFKNKKSSLGKCFMMDPESMGKLLTDVELIVEIFDRRLANMYSHKACYLEMIGLITQKDFGCQEAAPIIEGFLISILKTLNAESLGKRAIEVFTQDELVFVAENMRIYLQKCFDSYFILLKDDKGNNARILLYFQRVLMLNLLQQCACVEDADFFNSRVLERDSVLYQNFECQAVHASSPRASSDFNAVTFNPSAVTNTKFLSPSPVNKGYTRG